jgi:hypothetical protein
MNSLPRSLFALFLVTVSLHAAAGERPERHPRYEPEWEVPADLPEPDGLGLRGGVGDTDTRYPKWGAQDLAPAANGIELTAWRGEHVGAQVVVTSDVAEANLRLSSLRLWTEDGADSLTGEAYFVRYVLSNRPPEDDPEGPCVQNSAWDHIGFWPDCLDTAARLPLEAQANRPVWIKVAVPRNAAPGHYAGELEVRSDSGTVVFPVRLEVLEATLPVPEDWGFHLDIWQQPESVARYHRVDLWSPEHFALLRPLMTRLAQAGQKTITCSLYNEPWNAQTYDWIPGMVEWRKLSDGSWEYDYTVFDRWVEFMSEEIGLNDARIHCYTMVPWSLTFRYTDVAQQATVDLELTPGTPEYDAHWGPFLRDFVRHLRAKGWLERARISMDEREDELMHGALDTLARHAPELKVASAVNVPTELLAELDDVSRVMWKEFPFDPAELEARRQEGKISTFYVCCAPRHPNTFPFSPPAESQWLGIFAAANGFDGVLRWAYNSWIEDPFVSTDFTAWPSGDTFLIYPGNRSSIRWERLRDGIEDFEKIQLLRAWAAARPNEEVTTALAALDATLKAYAWPRGETAGVHAGDVRATEAAINDLARIVASSGGD